MQGNQSRTDPNMSAISLTIHESLPMIPVDSLLLLGIIYCSGFISHKARAFHRIACPEQEKVVSFTDRDLE